MSRRGVLLLCRTVTAALLAATRRTADGSRQGFASQMRECRTFLPCFLAF